VTDRAAQAVAELESAVAREMEPALPLLTDELVAHFVEMIPELRFEDEDIRELLVASAHSNLATAMDIFAHGIPVDQVEVPAAAAHYVRRMAQRDVPVESLLRAYRLGGALFLQWWLNAVGRHHPAPEVLLAATQHTAAVETAYIDRVSETLVEIYDDERKLWGQRAAATRAVQVRTVLLDEDLDPTTAEALTGYRMHGSHVAVVAWSTAPDSGRDVEASAALIAEVSGVAPLAVLADDRTLWVWISGPKATGVDPAELDAELRRRGSPVRVALGSPGVGLVGFRSSHHEALGAQRVANIRGDDDPGVTAFADVALSVFLSRDLAATRRWVAEVLGGLALDDDPMAELRRTVLLFLQSGASLTEAAVALHLHKNTVRYRLRKAEDVRGRPISERRLDVETALLACQHLGTSVLIRTGL
jgi:PucR C-terminal helix-turn-helix domain/GGDEF-like domain